jgi:hypothetical protein
MKEILSEGRLDAVSQTLTSLLLKLDVSERQHALAEAFTILFEEDTQQARAKNYPIYDPKTSLGFQTRKLSKLGYAQATQERVNPLSIQLHTIHPSDSSIPYILVIPHTIVPLEDQLKAIGAQNFLNIADLENLPAYTSPQNPYLITEVQCGEHHKNLSTTDALKTIEQERRHPFTFEETVALLTQLPNITFYQSVVAAATRHLKEYPPELYFAGTEEDDKNCIKVKRETLSLKSLHRGFPSYKQRILG